VVAAHGLRGAVRVRHFGETPDHLMRAKELWLGASEQDEQALQLTVARVESGRPGEVRLSFAGIGDRDGAGALKGRLVMVGAEQIERLPDGEYYEYEFVGCRVEGDDGRAIGTVRAVWSTGGADVLLVEGEGGDEHLIPTGGNFLREVDLAGKRIVIELIPGLLEKP
jgi:16S rRNA processing protein RimM